MNVKILVSERYQIKSSIPPCIFWVFVNTQKIHSGMGVYKEIPTKGVW